MRENSDNTGTNENPKSDVNQNPSSKIDDTEIDSDLNANEDAPNNDETTLIDSNYVSPTNPQFNDQDDNVPSISDNADIPESVSSGAVRIGLFSGLFNRKRRQVSDDDSENEVVDYSKYPTFKLSDFLDKITFLRW